MIVNRPELGRVWALSGARFDPGTQKYNLGWTAEIPTYEVLNYLQYRTDLALLSAAQRGIPEWGNDLTYGLGSVVWDNKNGTVYTSKVATPNKSKAPSDNPNEWEISSTQFTMNSFLALNKKIDDHVAARNDPHNVTADQVDTYIKSVIDSKVAKVDGDISNHVNRKDNPHGVTAAQAGAVPVTGGTYTGAVTFNASETKINTGAGDQAVMADANRVALRYADAYLGIRKSDKRATIKVGSKEEVLMSETEYVAARALIEPSYAVPCPDVWIDALSDIHLRQGFGFTELQRSVAGPYTDKSGNPQTAAPGMPRHEREGLRIEWGLSKERLALDANNNMSGIPEATWFIEGHWATGQTDRVILYWDDSAAEDYIDIAADGAVTVKFRDPDNAERKFLAGNLVDSGVFRLAVSFTTQRVRTYLNGVAGAAGDMTFMPSTQYAKVYLGFPGPEPAGGVWHLRQFKAWHRVLTQEQISTL
ncbi:hypothetical protein [Aeromonas phage PVN05]|nr:hypothetical protein [Aeromonas phage PVN05]